MLKLRKLEADSGTVAHCHVARSEPFGIRPPLFWYVK